MKPRNKGSDRILVSLLKTKDQCSAAGCFVACVPHHDGAEQETKLCNDIKGSGIKKVKTWPGTRSLGPNIMSVSRGLCATVLGNK